MQFPSSVDHKPSLSRPAGSSKRRGPASRRPASCRLLVEALEDRCLLSFSPIATYAVGTYPIAVATADFNADFVLDLAVVNNSSSSISVLLGNADGTFQPAVNSRTDTIGGAGVYPRSLAVGDFDGDGNTDDVATVNSGDVSILLGNGDGTFLLQQTLSLPAQTVPGYVGDLAQSPLSVAVGDLTSDGKIDLAVTSQTAFTTRNGPYTGYDYWGNPYNFYTYDQHYNGHVNVLVGDGAGNFTPPAAGAVQLLAGSYPISALLEQLDSVPGLDLATADNFGHDVRVLSGNGDGTFDAPVDYPAGWYPSSVMTGDINGDGISDLITADSGSVSVLLGNPGGTFQSPKSTSLSHNGSVAVGDVDADGKLDLVGTSTYATYDYWSGWYYTDYANVLLGNGDGTFAGPISSVLASSWDYTVAYASSPALGNFDAGAFPDLVATNPYGNLITVGLNANDWVLPATLTIGDDVTVTEGDSGTPNAVFKVTRSGVLDTTVTVDFTTGGGNAQAGSDYQYTSGTLTFAPNVTELTITVPIIDDFTHESDEVFYVTLSSPTNANINDSQAVGTIKDNDPPATLSVGDVTVTEGNSGTVEAVFMVTRGGNLAGTVTVNYSTANGGALAGSDYVATSGSRTFGPGVTTQTITVLVNGDVTDEYDQSFYVNLSNPSGAEIIDGQGEGMILDNDAAPTISITAKVSAKEGKNNTTTLFNFIVTLSAPSEKEVRVNFATANGTASTADNDYVASSGTLVFAAGDTSETISVVVKGDKKKESNETFFVNLGGATNATIKDGQGLGEILDDDAPGR